MFVALRASKALLVVCLAVCSGASVNDLLATSSAARRKGLVTRTANDTVILSASVLALDRFTAKATCEALAMVSAFICRHRLANHLLSTPQTIGRALFVAALTPETKCLVLEVGANDRAAACVTREAFTVVTRTLRCDTMS